MIKRSLLRAVVITALCFLLCQLASGQNSQQADSIFSDEHLATEVGQLRQLSEADKAKVRRALTLLQDALANAAVSTDTEEIARFGNAANAAVNAAVLVIPNGAFRGSLISCDKALGHSYILRLVGAGSLDPNDPEVTRTLQEIMLRYQLARIPAYERPAKVLDYAEAHLTITRMIATRAGILPR
jgi:hypothetical protein